MKKTFIKDVFIQRSFINQSVILLNRNTIGNIIAETKFVFMR